MSSTPDISVIIPVYNTLPYLKRCLSSVLQQTLRPGRMEIVAVDDGSTDGSGHLLDRLAKRRPSSVKVIHQSNSGGPAAPCNRGLENAAGRYVFFLGSDDYLAPHALGRLVSAADRFDSDVVLGKVVGVNSRFLFTGIFDSTREDIDFINSRLAWSLANTKLFRRSLIEQHRIRYHEDMPILSDQLFTVAACHLAKRISVLADHDYYYAVRRLNGRNITYSNGTMARLPCVERLITSVASLMPPGPERDAVLVRHFGLELAGLLSDEFLQLDQGKQEQVFDVAQRLAREHLNENIRRQLGVEARFRLALAEAGDLVDLVTVVRHDAELGPPPAIQHDGRWYAAYRLSRDRDVTDYHMDWLARATATSVRFKGFPAHTMTLRVLSAQHPAGLELQYLLGDLIARSQPSGRRHAILVDGAPLRGPKVPRSGPRLCWDGARLYAARVVRASSGQLTISIVPITFGRVFALLARALRRRNRRNQS